MEITKFLEAKNSSDPNEFIKKLQDFFNQIQNVAMSEAYTLVGLYSTADVLLANGMNKESVKAVKKACISKMVALYDAYPASVKQSAIAIKCLAAGDDFSTTEQIMISKLPSL